MPPSCILSPRRPSSSPRPAFSMPPSAAPAAPPLPPAMPVEAPPEVFRRCDNCQGQILTSNFELHEVHCLRNRRRCEACNELLPVGELESHRKERRGSMPVLSEALRNGDAARVRAALDHDDTKAALSWANEQGETLLHLAVAAARDRWDMQEIVEEIVRLGASVTCQDQVGWTPLHAAARSSAAAAVRCVPRWVRVIMGLAARLGAHWLPFESLPCSTLVNAGADVHARGGSFGSTALEVSVGEEVRLALLAAGAALPGSLGSSRSASRPGSGPGIGGLVPRPPSAPRDAAAGLSDALEGACISGAPRGHGQESVTPRGGRASSSRHAQRLRAVVMHGEGTPPSR